MVPEIGDIATRGVLTVIARVFVTAIVLIASAGFTYNLVQPAPQYDVIHQIGYEITGINEIIQTSPGPVKIIYLNERVYFEDGVLKINDDFFLRSVEQLPKTTKANLVLGSGTVNYQDFILRTESSNEEYRDIFKYPSTANNNDLGIKILSQFNSKYDKRESILYDFSDFGGKCINKIYIDYNACENEEIETESVCIINNHCYWSVYENKCFSDKCEDKTNSIDCLYIRRDNNTKRNYCEWETDDKTLQDCEGAKYNFGEGVLCKDGLVFEKSDQSFTLNQKTALKVSVEPEDSFEKVYNILVNFSKGTHEEKDLINHISLPTNFIIGPKVQKDTGEKQLCLLRRIDYIDSNVLRKDIDKTKPHDCEEAASLSKGLKSGNRRINSTIILDSQSNDSYLRCCGFDISFNEFCLNQFLLRGKLGIYCGVDNFSRPISRVTQNSNGIITNHETGIVSINDSEWDKHEYCKNFGCNWFSYDEYWDMFDFEFNFLERDDYLNRVKKRIIPNFRTCNDRSTKISIPKNFKAKFSEITCLKIPKNISRNIEYDLKIFPLGLQSLKVDNKESEESIQYFLNPSSVKVYENNGEIISYGDSFSLILHEEKIDKSNVEELEKKLEKNKAYFGWTNALICGETLGEDSFEKLYPGVGSIEGIKTKCAISVKECVDMQGFPLKLQNTIPSNNCVKNEICCVFEESFKQSFESSQTNGGGTIE